MHNQILKAFQTLLTYFKKSFTILNQEKGHILFQRKLKEMFDKLTIYVLLLWGL